MNLHPYLPGWNVYDYLPPLFASYLIGISGLSGGLLQSLLTRQLRDSATPEQVQYIKNVTLDWATRTSFITSTVAAIISILVTFAEPRAYGWAATVIVVVLLVYLPINICIWTYKVGDLPALAETRIWNGKYIMRSPAWVCNAVQIFFNILGCVRRVL